jgi:outer membrane protein OmpA-like peptidoglycan-associated protein
MSAEEARQVRISVREGAASGEIAGWQADDLVLGSILFDYGKATIRPDYRALLDRIAAQLERSGGGRVAVIGHTDVHGSHEFNTRLGLARARAVYEAIAARLSPQLRAKVKVEVSADPRAPVGTRPEPRP